MALGGIRCLIPRRVLERIVRPARNHLTRRLEMKFLRSILMLLLSLTTVLLIVQTTAAAAGKGGQGPEAAVAIDIIRLTNLNGGKILAEISGGGFLGGANGARSVEVILNDVTSLRVTVHSAEMLEAKIPGGTPDGDHTITVRTGEDNKQTDSATIRLGGEMTVSCISFFLSGPADEHIHTEVHVEDENGEAVIGAQVTWTAGNDTVGVYQENTSLTHDNDGHAAGENCPVDENGDPDVSGSGVTDWFCCIGAGKWDSDGPPGNRACASGEYTATIVDVVRPLFTNMTWDEVIVETPFTHDIEDR
jgi:hypothetical protein